MWQRFPRYILSKILKYSNYSSKSWIVTLLKEKNHIYLEALCMPRNTSMECNLTCFGARTKC
jgi:hypothetical protein